MKWPLRRVRPSDVPRYDAGRYLGRYVTHDVIVRDVNGKPLVRGNMPRRSTAVIGFMRNTPPKEGRR